MDIQVPTSHKHEKGTDTKFYEYITFERTIFWLGIIAHWHSPIGILICISCMQYYYYYAKCENVNISEDENCFCKAYISTNIFRMIMVQKNLQATKFRERGVLRYPWPETFVGNRPSSNSVEMIIAIIFIFIYGY